MPQSLNHSVMVIFAKGAFEKKPVTMLAHKQGPKEPSVLNLDVGLTVVDNHNDWKRTDNVGVGLLIDSLDRTEC